MLEERFGYKFQRSVLQGANLGHDGIYVKGGNYPYEEMVQLVVALSEQSKIAVPVLLREFGQFLFGRLVKIHPYVIQEQKSALDLIASIHDYIHVEMRKLHPDAELPVFETVERSDAHIVVLYQSAKKMEALAEGMMLGCGEYFRTPLDIQQEPQPNTEVHTVKFTVRLKPEVAYEAVEKTQRGFWSRITSIFKRG